MMIIRIITDVEAVVIDMDDIVITPKKKMHKRDIYVTDDSLPVGNKVGYDISYP